MIGDADQARKYAVLCLGVSKTDDIELVYQRFAYETTARAVAIQGNNVEAREYILQAQANAKFLTDQVEQEMLWADLNSIPV